MDPDSLNDSSTDAESQGAGAAQQGGEDMARLDALIARDEAADAQARTVAQSRQSNGRFGAGEKNGQRQAERATPEVISAKDARAAAQSKPAKAEPESKPTPAEGESPSAGKTDDPTAEQTETPSETGANGAEPSKYQRAKEREAKAWKEINSRKAELELERAAIESERQAVQTLRGQRQAAAGASRYSAQEYQQAAQTWNQQAQALEANGDFAGADEKRALAQSADQQAKELAARSASGAGQSSVSLETSWQRLKQDMPEVLHQGSAANKELLAILKAKPELLADGLGPYRAMLHAGRKLLAGQEIELTKVRAESAKVPGLQKQIEQLSAQIRELQEATSLPGTDPNLNRGGQPKYFGDLSTAEMESRLEREFAGSL